MSDVAKVEVDGIDGDDALSADFTFDAGHDGSPGAHILLAEGMDLNSIVLPLVQLSKLIAGLKVIESLVIDATKEEREEGFVRCSKCNHKVKVD